MLYLTYALADSIQTLPNRYTVPEGTILFEAWDAMNLHYTLTINVYLKKMPLAVNENVIDN